MNNTFSPEEQSKSGIRDANLKLRQNKIASMSMFMEIKSPNPKVRQDQKQQKK